MTLDPTELLAGPRGRRFCLEFALAAARERVGWGGDPEAPDAEQRLGWAAMRAEAVLDPDAGTAQLYAYADAPRWWPSWVRGVVYRPLLRRARRQEEAQRAEQRADPGPLLATLAGALGELELPEATPDRIMHALNLSVNNSRPWQPPDGLDVATRDPGVRAALTRVARHLAPACGWFERPADPEASWRMSPLRWTDDGPVERDPEPAPDPGPDLAAAREQAREQESLGGPGGPESDARVAPVQDLVSGIWWSAVGASVRSSGPVPGSDLPVGMWCEEDSCDPSERSAMRLAVTPTDRVLEIRTEQDWVELCSRFPLDVTLGRRGCWAMNTGRDALAPQDGTEPGWVVPDLAAVAEHHDGVHLTVAAYLALVGRGLPVPGHGASAVAGWNADETVWLTPRRALAGTRTAWRWDGDADTWVLARA